MKLQFRQGNNAEIFATKDYSAFNKLMFDTAFSKTEGDITLKDANTKIREVFLQVIGCDETSDKREIRKATRRNQIAVFEVMEELIPNLLHTGWDQNPFFVKYVERKNGAIGDTNEFVVEDQMILTVSKLSGNHHDLRRQRLAEGSTFRVETSWYGVNV